MWPIKNTVSINIEIDWLIMQLLLVSSFLGFLWSNFEV